MLLITGREEVVKNIENDKNGENGENEEKDEYLKTNFARIPYIQYLITF